MNTCVFTAFDSANHRHFKPVPGLLLDKQAGNGSPVKDGKRQLGKIVIGQVHIGQITHSVPREGKDSAQILFSLRRGDSGHDKAFIQKRCRDLTVLGTTRQTDILAQDRKPFFTCIKIKHENPPFKIACLLYHTSAT